MSSRAEQKEATRRALLDAALRLSAERGVSSLSLRQVAKEAGIAPTSFYRHFENLDDLSLALVDEVGRSLRLLVRRARQRTLGSGKGRVVRTSIETFMEFVGGNANLFRLLLGEGSGSTPAFRRALAKEIRRFTDDVVDNLEHEAKVQRRPLAHARLAAEAMVTVTFNLGAAAIDLPPEQQAATTKRIIQEVHMIMRGAEAMAAGWLPPEAEPIDCERKPEEG